MRIISGTFGSRRLGSARGLALRPTSDRLREALFDILQGQLEGCIFVDGYAGTGAVGIEAASRGAARVIFLEKHRAAVALIRRNLEALGITAGVEIIPRDVCRGLADLAARGSAADFLFFDPPYEESEEYQRVLESLDGSPLVASHTRIIFERLKKRTLPERVGRMARTRTVTQGDAALDFFALKIR
jgi:16S rRNA (guanine(966)-N(2))-methyltransferase RsmD